MNGVQQLVQKLILGQAKRSGKWFSLNAKCCIHNGGHRADTKGRAGFIFGGDGSVGMSCFNCGYASKYTLGGYLSKKMKDVMKWYGASSQDVMRADLIARESLNLEQLRSNTQVTVQVEPKDLPKDAAPFEYWMSLQDPPKDFLEVIFKMYERNPALTDIDGFWWSPETDNHIHRRFLVPFFHQGEPIGYTGRAVDSWNSKRFFNQYSNSIIYNMDVLTERDRTSVLVHEAPIDAMFTRGVGICHYQMKECQMDILDSCDKVKIVVPDRDKDGKRLAQQALIRGWSVTFPDWGYIETDGNRRLIKDTEEAVRVYGRAFTVYMIYNSVLSSSLQIKMKMNTWFKE